MRISDCVFLKNPASVFRSFFVVFVLIFIVIGKDLRAQEKTNPYPKIAGYAGIVHPLVSFSTNKPEYNFHNYYVGGFVGGINIWKSSRVGFSLEFVPYLRVQDGMSKTSNFLFHPGLLVALGHGWTFAGRAAFETSGRYGFTPVINKIVKKNKNSGYFIAIPVPVRFGNNHASTLTIGFQFGISF